MAGFDLSTEGRVAEKVILGALRDRLLQPEPVCQVLDRVHEEVKALCAHVPDMLKAKTAQLAAARLRVDRIVNFVSLGRAQDSKALAEALAENEALVVSLEAEVENLRQASDSRVRFPSRAWIEKRLAALRELLERRTEASGLLLRRLLGRMVLEPVYPDQGVPYYVAKTSLDVLVLLEHPGPGPDPGSDPGANSFGWWRRRVLHSGPQRAWGSRYLGQLPPAPQSAAATGHVNSLGIDLATVDDTWREVGGTVADRTAEVAVGMASPRAELLCVGARRGPTPPATHRGRRTRHRRGDRLAGVTVVPGRPRTQGAAAGTVRAAVRGCRRQAVVSGGGTFPAARAPIRHAAAA